MGEFYQARFSLERQVKVVVGSMNLIVRRFWALRQGKRRESKNKSFEKKEYQEK